MRFRVIHAGKRNLETLSFPVSRCDRVRAVDPAIRVQHVLGQILTVNAIDRIANVLPGSDDQRERDEKDDRETVVQPEHSCVDVHVRDLDQAFQASEYVQHFGWLKKRRSSFAVFSSDDETLYHWIINDFDIVSRSIRSSSHLSIPLIYLRT